MRFRGKDETTLYFCQPWQLANGLLNSVELILGKQPDIHTLCAYVEEEADLTQQVEALMARFPAQDELIVITDIFAGSVNNEFVRFFISPTFPFIIRFKSAVNY